MKRSSVKKQVPVSDLSGLLKPYNSGWVALSSDERRVIASGKTLSETREQAASRGTADAVFVKVIPPEEGYLPPSCEISLPERAKHAELGP